MLLSLRTVRTVLTPFSQPQMRWRIVGSHERLSFASVWSLRARMAFFVDTLQTYLQVRGCPAPNPIAS